MRETVELSGMAISFSSGAFGLMGWSLLGDPMREQNILLRQALGGGLVVLGLYMFSPAFLREFWNK